MAAVPPSTLAVQKRGKQKAIDPSDASNSDSDVADISSSSDSESESDDDITQDYLDALLERARQNAAAAEIAAQAPGDNEDILTLEGVEQTYAPYSLEEETTPYLQRRRPLPKLDPGALPAPYLQLGRGRGEGGVLVRDPDIEAVENKSLHQATCISPPLPPPELTKAGKSLTKKEKRELKRQTAGPDWFDMPAPAESDLPRLYREVEALRLRNQLDPKRFYRKDEGEGKGIKGLPKYIAVGQIIATGSPFGNASGDNLPRSQRKRTLVDELVDDAEAKRYAKKKFSELQTVRGAKGKNTLRIKEALRKPKW